MAAITWRLAVFTVGLAVVSTPLAVFTGVLALLTRRLAVLTGEVTRLSLPLAVLSRTLAVVTGALAVLSPPVAAFSRGWALVSRLLAALTRGLAVFSRDRSTLSRALAPFSARLAVLSAPLVRFSAGLVALSPTLAVLATRVAPVATTSVGVAPTFGSDSTVNPAVSGPLHPMNAKQGNKLAMYRAVVTLLTASSTQIGRLPALVAKFGALKTKIDRLFDLAGTQALPSAGAVASKEQALLAMADAAATVAGAVGSYASEKGLPTLAGRVTVSNSDLRYGRQQNRVVIAQQILDAATTVVGQLADYGVTPATLTDLTAKIATATQALSAPRGAVTARKAATEELEPVIGEIDRLLEEEIDPLLLGFKATDPQFYRDYQAARIIIDRPGGRNAKATTVTAISTATTTSAATPAATS